MKTLLVSLLVSSVAWAQVSSVEIQNFNFNYTAPLGEGSADAFSYQKKENAGQQVYVEKINGEFKIILSGVENQELTFKDAPDFVSLAETISLKNFNLLYTDRVSLTMASGKFISPEKSVDFKNFNLGCTKSSAGAELMDQIINGCLQKLSLKTGGLSTDGEGIEQAFMKAFDDKHDAILASVGIKNLDLKINSGKFDLSAEIQAQISGSAKGNGSVSYDSAAKKVTVKISQVKFGFLDVTSQVFDEIKKSESETLKVKKPYVYLTIK